MKTIHIFVILLATAFQASGVEFFDNLIRRAAEEGFENLYMERGESKAPVLFYENRVYRDEFYAAAVLLAICEKELPEAEHIILCRCRNRVPLVELAVDLTDYRRIVRDGEPMAASEWLTLRSPRHKLPREAEVREKAAGRFDLILTPGLSLYLGNYDDRFKAHLQVLPALSTHLWRGGSIMVEAAVPLYSDVNYQSYRFKSYSQLNRVVLSQFMRLPGNVFLFLHAGAFYPNRWGFGGEAVKWLLHRQLALGYRLEYTGFLLYFQNQLYYSQLG
ncbi:MAG: YjbH domain-containing protein, partial [candidate division KSB1 bacterium]|nr:YjbH domain-containing protein [candidate division KSB1 bacterium]